MGYATTTGIILYWKPDKPFVIRRAHNVWFDKYNSCITIGDKHTQGSLLVQKYTESIP